MSKKSGDAPRILNINIGILGHVDSGKTSLARALSTELSTAALDRNPQSQERGITLDLGFSAFSAELPPRLQHLPYDKLQFTLVDCPGHASLIRTIIGGAQIIDVMFLVIDINKGIQTQTAECLVIGEILTNNMIVVLNKIDLIPESGRADKVDKIKKKLREVFKSTRFGADVPMVAVSACVGAALSLNTSVASAAAVAPSSVFDVKALVDHLMNTVEVPVRERVNSPFLFSVDHCFPIKGQGTVMTGTVLAGTVNIHDNIEIVELRDTKKVKSMQMFHRPVASASQGDRVGLCVTQLDHQVVERGLVAAPGLVPTIAACVARVEKIRFFKGRVRTGAKFHFTTGHTTTMGTVHFFCAPALESAMNALSLGSTTKSSIVGSAQMQFDWNNEYLHLDELLSPAELVALLSRADGQLESDENASAASAVGAAPTASAIDPSLAPPQFALIRFDLPLLCPMQSLLIGSKLDTDIHTNSCRLAFNGRLLSVVDVSDNPSSAPIDADSSVPVPLHRLQVFKRKQREGVVDRVVDACSVIGNKLFAKEADMNQFTNLKVEIGGVRGRIEGAFGKGGKFKAYFPDGLPAALTEEEKGKKKGPPAKILLKYKSYVFGAQERKKFVQNDKHGL